MQHTRRYQSGRSVADEAKATIYYSASQRALIWERWQKGETQFEGELLQREHIGEVMH
jgi:hypothetical protein